MNLVPCQVCGVEVPYLDTTSPPPSRHPGACAQTALPCAQCDGPDDRYCACWIALDGLPLADIKGLLADVGLSVEVPK